MDSTLATVFAIFLAVVLMAVVPLMLSAGQQDNIAQISVQALIDEYGGEIVATGVLTQEDLAALEQALAATGNSYDIVIEISKLDENPGKKTSDGSTQIIGENVYYIMYTSQVESELEARGEMLLNEGDRVKIEVKNSNTTLFQLFKGFIYQTPAGSSTIVGIFVGQVQENGARTE